MTYQQCNKCLLDTTVPNITFNSDGVCNYCDYYAQIENKHINVPEELKNKKLRDIVTLIKKNSKKSQYDCIIGLSGGVDSSYLCLLAKQFNLNPLLVHFDNGWNTESAVINIENITKKLGFDLYTYVLDWEEFKDLQRSYFKANVLDLEVPTDQLIGAALFEIAYKKNIKYILSGHNFETEAINPVGWTCKIKEDYQNLKDIHNRFGEIKLKNLPKMSIFKKYVYERIFGIQQIILLNYVPYKKNLIKEKIKSELGWKDYGWKHFESIFTRFYQGYILPKKSNIDKRKMHLSNLIMSKQISKTEAILEMKQEFYPLSLQDEDLTYVTKKLGFSDDFMQEYLSKPHIPHENYLTNNQPKIQILFFLLRVMLYLPIRLLLFAKVIPKKIENSF